MDQDNGNERTIDNRVFLLGLEYLYRESIKRHEAGELLVAARRVAGGLQVGPAGVPVEGCYGENPQLSEYFRIMRALQNVHVSRTSAVADLTEYNRLFEVASAPLFGRAEQGDKLLPVGRDALSEALAETAPDWTVTRLTAAAHAAALGGDDYSLVGLAATIQDPVVLAALRESVVLYAAPLVVGGVSLNAEYVWEVDADLAAQARRFLEAYCALFREELPTPDLSQAARYWYAASKNRVYGRCVRLGQDRRCSPVRHYHWAIGRDGRELAVRDLWDTEMWTTERYRGDPTAFDRRSRARDSV